MQRSEKPLKHLGRILLTFSSLSGAEICKHCRYRPEQDPDSNFTFNDWRRYSQEQTSQNFRLHVSEFTCTIREKSESTCNRHAKGGTVLVTRRMPRAASSACNSAWSTLSLSTYDGTCRSSLMQFLYYIIIQCISNMFLTEFWIFRSREDAVANYKVFPSQLLTMRTETGMLRVRKMCSS